MHPYEDYRVVRGPLPAKSALALGFAVPGRNRDDFGAGWPS